jgi:hypothetical protein
VRVASASRLDVRPRPRLPCGRSFTRGRIFTVRGCGKNRVRSDVLMRPRRRDPASAWTHSRPRGHERVRADIGPSARTRSSPCPRPPSIPPRGRNPSARTRHGRPKKNKIKKNKKLFLNFFMGCWLLEKRGKKCSVFGFQSPRSPSSAGEAARRRRFFWPSSPSHPSKLYSSLGWLNSKVPKPFFPFTPRLIDVDGF